MDTLRLRTVAKKQLEVDFDLLLYVSVCYRQPWGRALLTYQSPDLRETVVATPASPGRAELLVLGNGSNDDLCKDLPPRPEGLPRTLIQLLAMMDVGDPAAVASALLREMGSLNRVLKSDAWALQNITGVTPKAAKALSHVGDMLLESEKERLVDRLTLRGTEAATDYVRAILRDNPIERLCVLFMTEKFGLIGQPMITDGGSARVTLYVEEVVRKAVQRHARKVFIAHSHPSGVPTPSSPDTEKTHRLHSALALLDIDLVDHVIVGADSAFSFASGKSF